MTIQRVIITNYKRLRSVDIQLEAGTNVIVGNNESGKSTLLEAVNLALTGQINRRPAAYEMHPYLFNRTTVAEFVANVKAGNRVLPPEIAIELYFRETTENARLMGMHNSRGDDRARGVTLKIKLDEENFGAEYGEYISNAEAVNDVPIEYYKIEWRSFASSPQLTAKAIPVKSSLIDPSSISNTYAANKYVLEAMRGYLTQPQKIDLALTYRQMKDEFQSDDRIQAINTDLARQRGVVSDKTLSVAMDTTTRASWETGILPYLDDIPLTLVGKGEQNSVKIKLAMRAAETCDLFLMEEPENHLSHTNLGKLIQHICDQGDGKQLIVSTHSSFVLNKLGVENVLMFNGEHGVSLDDLPEGTQSYFNRLPGHDTLRMILAERTILVEGPSDELIVGKGYRQRHNKLPLEDGVEVIAVGTSFKRFLDIAYRLNIDVCVVRDNDGESARIGALYDTFTDVAHIEVYVDPDNEARTLEPQIIKSNGLDKLNHMLGSRFATIADLETYMLKNKTDVALKLFEHADDLIIPDYIANAIR